MTSSIFTSFTLPNGQVLKNRLVKAAMEENLATSEHLPGNELRSLYNAWAEGGVGLILTGNVMVDHLAMTGPAGLVLEQETDLTPFIELAKLSKTNNTKIWMQINHPGRQVFKKMGGKVLSPSDVALNMGKHSAMFCAPKPMDEDEIQDVIQRFTTTASAPSKRVLMALKFMRLMVIYWRNFYHLSPINEMINGEGVLKTALVY